MSRLDGLREDGYTWYRNASEGVRTPAYWVGGAGHGHNTEREGRAGPVGTRIGRTGQEEAVEVERRVADEIAIVAGVLASGMGDSQEEGGLRRPSEVVHGHSQFGWNHQSISIDRPREDFRAGRVWSGSRARTRWQP